MTISNQSGTAQPGLNAAGSKRVVTAADMARSPEDVRERLQQLAGLMGPKAVVGDTGGATRKTVEHRLAGLAVQAEGARQRLATTGSSEVDATLSRIGAGMAGLAREAATTVDAGSDPWDHEAAEALSRIYEADLPASLAAADQAAVVAPATPVAATVKTVSAANDGRKSAVALVTGPAGDAGWLDQRLAELGRKVEAALAAADPAEGFAALDRRLDRFEQRFDDAMERWDRHADPAPLRVLETQLGDIRTHLEATQRQLARLDGIEQQVRALDGLGRTGDAAGGIAGFDPDAFVARLSERLATDRQQALVALPDHEPRLAAQSQGLSELRQALDGFIADQRQAQVQTAGTLGTMQEALIRLIDRIEEVEAAADADHAGHVRHAAAPTPDADGFITVEDERTPTPGRRASDRAVHGTSAPAATASDMAAGDPATAAAAVVPAAAGSMPTAESDAASAAVAPERHIRSARSMAARAPAVADARPEDKAAADALAAERAKVAASRIAAAASGAAKAGAARVGAAAASRSSDAAPAARPSRTLASAQAATAAAAPPGAAQRGLRIAGIAALLIGLSTASFMLVDRYGPRLQSSPASRPIVVVPADAPKSAEGNELPTRTEPSERPLPAAQRLEGQPVTPVAPGAIDVRTPETGAPRPRPSPETVTEDLSLAPREAPSLAATALARPSQAGMTGIILDGPALPNPAELARRLAPPQAQPAVQPAPSAERPAPSAAARTTAALPDAAPETANARPALVEMPPAQIGPTSLRIAAQQGDPSAQFEVAARFAEAKGVKQDFEQAHIWYQRAAQRGFIPAQYRLATLIERGLGTPADLARAKAWYRRAADQGNIKAMHNLAVLATTETPETPDYNAAAKWFTQAAERGLADSQYNLAVLHDNGLGVAKDHMQAYLWYALAARSGDKEAIKRRDQIFASLTPGQTRDAEKLVANWRARPTDLKANDVRAAANAWKAEQEQMQARMGQFQAEAMARRAADEAAAAAQQSAAAPKASGPVVRPATITTKAVPMPQPMRP